MPANTIEEQFAAAIRAAGIEPPDTISADGTLHRFKTSGRGPSKNGWYVLHGDAVPCGFFGCWKTFGDERLKWTAKPDSALTDAERQAMSERMRQFKEQHEAEVVKKRKDARKNIASALEAAQPATADHPYLVKKGVQPHGLKTQADGALLVPLRDLEGTLHSGQQIYGGRGKFFFAGGRISGTFYAIGKRTGTTVICEGFATGAAIHEATGLTVLCAMSAGNLAAVAQALRAKYPGERIVIALDDDWRTDGNPGITKGQAAAQAVGGITVAPTFQGERPDWATDFNDMANLHGQDAVRQAFETVLQAHAPTSTPAPATAARPDPVFPPLEDDAHQSANPHAVVLVNGAELVPRPVAWLWRHWLALGKLHILAGAPGQGKTTLALAMAATVTIGGRWPDGTSCAPGNILMWSGEDDPADTLLPRLLASGAVRERCHFIKGAIRDGVVEPFDPARDLVQLREAIERIGGVRLLIVDPVVNAVTGDSHKNTETRRALQPLVDLADSCGCAVLGITHFAKGGQGTDPAQRVIGSVAFTAVARIVLVAAKVQGEDGKDSRVLARAKSNIGPDDGGFEYHLMQCEPLPGIQASCIAWGEAVEGTARELLTDPDEPEGGASDAAGMLSEELATDCWTSYDTAAAPLRKAGFTKKQIWAASNKLGVIRKKGAMKDGWYWRLPGGIDPAIPAPMPEDSAEDSEGSSFKSRESSESSGVLESSVAEVL